MSLIRRINLASTGMALVLPVAVFAQDAPSDFTYGTRYDPFGRVTATIAPDPDGLGPLTYAAVRNSYDTAGRLIKVEKGKLSSWKSEADLPESWGSSFALLSSVETSYDALGRKTREAASGSDNGITAITQYSYDAAGRLECTALRMNPATYPSLPASACSHATAGANGPDRITRNLYDDSGQLLQVRMAVGTAIEIADATYTYTANGKQKFVIDANGNKAEKRYDGHDRQVRWMFPSTTRPSAYTPTTPANAVTTAGALNEADYEAYGYDAAGNQTTLRKRDGSTLTFTFDALNRMTTKVVPERSGLASTATRDVYYGYDLRGLQTYVRFDSSTGEGISHTYDGLGRQLTATSNLNGQSRTLTFQYDANGNRTKLTWPDSAYITKEFDGLDREVVARNNSSQVLLSRAYDDRGMLQIADRPGLAYDQSFSYDNAGRLSSMGVINGTVASRVAWQFTRNAASQLAGESRDNNAYAWNGHANLSRNYTTNGLNQYTAAGPATFCYDGNGNLTADGSNVYLYDVENRLVEKRAQANTACTALSYSGALKASLRYDPFGRLYEVTGSSVTRFLYDGDALVAEYDATGNLLKRYVHGNDAGADDPLIEFVGSLMADSSARHLYADPRGSIVLTGDAVGNAVGSINTYDEYGIPGAGNQGRFQYTGQAWLEEVGIYHFKARVYSPYLGRFLQTDPIGYDDQTNIYGYVGNDPLNNVDFSGMCTGSRIESEGGTCASTGGFSTGLDGLTEGATIDKAVNRVIASVAQNRPDLGKNRPEKGLEPSPAIAKILSIPIISRKVFSSVRSTLLARRPQEFGFVADKDRHGNISISYSFHTAPGSTHTQIQINPGESFLFFHTHPLGATSSFNAGLSNLDIDVSLHKMLVVSHSPTGWDWEDGR